jgi:DNA-binding response OmpR family regulator
VLGVELLPSELEGKAVLGLTLKERQLLASFLTRTGVLTRNELHEALWRGVSVNRKTLDVHLFNLRRKIHPLGFDIVCEGQAYGLRKLEPYRQEQFSVG